MNRKQLIESNRDQYITTTTVRKKDQNQFQTLGCLEVTIDKRGKDIEHQTEGEKKVKHKKKWKWQ